MKRILTLCLLLALAALAVPGLVAAVGEVPNPGATYTVTLLKYDPVPAKPGTTVEAWIQLSNLGDRGENDLQLEIEDSYPFSPVSASDELVTVGTLSARAEYVAKVNLLVDPQAADGTYNVKVNVIRSDGSSRQFTLELEVQSGTSSFGISKVSTTPAELTPGAQSRLSFTIQNLEQSELQDVSVNVDFDDTVFAPIGSTNQQKISRLGGGESQTFTYEIVTEPDAESNVYRLPVTISATPNDGEEILQEETIGIVVSAKPELAVVVDSAELYKDQEQGTVLLRLVNKGLSQIKFVETELLSGDGYSLVGNSPVVYVGNIDSDDFETTEYTVKPTKDSFSIKLHVTYKDALNNQYEETVQLPITLQDSVKKSGASKWVVLLVVVVVIVGVVLWRRGRGKPNKR